MIKEIKQEDLTECVQVIRNSFATVAKEFNITEENAPRYTAFATDENRLNWHLNGEHRPMFGYVADGKIVGYCLKYSLSVYFSSTKMLNLSLISLSSYPLQTSKPLFTQRKVTRP